MIDSSDETYKNRQIFYYKEIDSTQKEIWRRIKKGTIKDRTIVIADIQTDGIGTHGRKWYTSQKQNIAFSFVTFPNVEIKKIENLTTEIAQIILQVFKENYNIKLDIKKPNDIVVKDKKIGGILTETTLQGKTVKNLVIGIGINTNQTTFNKEIENIATSIKNQFGITVDNKLIIQKFIEKFEKRVLKNLQRN